MSALQSIAMDLFFFHKDRALHLESIELFGRIFSFQERFENLPSQYIRDKSMLVDIFLIAEKIEDGLLDDLESIDHENYESFDQEFLLDCLSILNAIADLLIAYRHICDEELVGN